MRKVKRVPKATNQISKAPREQDGADAADAEAARGDHADVGTTTVKAAAERAAAAKAAAAAKGKAEVCAAARAEHRRPVGGIRLGIVVRLQQRQSTVSSAI